MTIEEAFDDPTSLMKNLSDYEDIASNYAKDKGVLLGSNDKEGRPETLWFKTKADKDTFLNVKS